MNGDAHPPNARFASAFAGLYRDPIKAVHCRHVPILGHPSG
jgi:hypothetical protein